MSHSETKSAQETSADRVLLRRPGGSLILLFVAWMIPTVICGRFELARLQDTIKTPAGFFGWFTGWTLDTTCPFLILIALPVLVGVSIWQNSWPQVVRRLLEDRTPAPVQSCRSHSMQGSTREESTYGRSPSGYMAIRAGLFLLSLACSASIGFREVEVPTAADPSRLPGRVPFYKLPPAYHDEFSYLLQADTFLAGRVAWPAVTVRPDLFHQIHVLNHPTTASRYFPLTGLWLAPFVRFANPYWGHWIAGGLSCVFFFSSLLKVLPFRWSLAGGLMIAVSPGLAIFSNLLLAHHPAMLMLSVFLLFFLRLMESATLRDAVFAGTFLSLAMLGRPMTAAGFALPFGAWLVWRILSGSRPAAETLASNASALNAPAGIAAPFFSWRLIPAIGAPLMIGFGILFLLNSQITGHWSTSAYQYYTDTWTPRHRYGFDNVRIGSELAGPEVVESYDRWAVNLTPAKSIENIQNRAIASAQWTLGIAALLFALVNVLPACWQRNTASLKLRLILLSVVSLHLVHVPYWYDGILHWHYVFETAPLLLMLCAYGMLNAFQTLQFITGRRTAGLWLFGLVASCLVPNWFDADTFWGPSRVSLAIGEQTFSRARFELFDRLTSSASVPKPALILVDEEGSDPQLSYIVNPPDMFGDVLVCRMPKEPQDLIQLQAAFPQRTLFQFDPDSFQLTRIPVR